jgi:diguanylate cyclase (GGDEF)-like protein
MCQTGLRARAEGSTPAPQRPIYPMGTAPRARAELMNAGNRKITFSDLRSLFARSANTYAGADIALARRFGRVNWAVGTLIVLILLPFFPPTEAIGSAGWIAALPGCLVTVVGYTWAQRHQDRISYDFLYGAGWICLAQLATLQWLAGGRIAPYHEIYLFLIIGTGLMHPPRRFAIFVAGVIAAGFAPAFYEPATARIGEIATEQTLWLGLGVFLLLLMRSIRAQRVALKQAGDEAHQLARVDQLTGLGNRRAFDEALAEQLADACISGAQVCLLVADLNDFKQINDLYGHVSGDDCLRQAAGALQSALRDSDSCYRWGGDEFAVLVGQASEGDAARLAERVERTVAGLCRGPDGRPLSVACGYAEIEGGATAAEAVAAADDVLLSLKRGEQAAARAV